MFSFFAGSALIYLYSPETTYLAAADSGYLLIVELCLGPTSSTYFERDLLQIA